MTSSIKLVATAFTALVIATSGAFAAEDGVLKQKVKFDVDTIPSSPIIIGFPN